jgi:MFS family permease
VVWRLGWVSFFADVCSEMVYPIIPIFITVIGAPVAALGLIEGVATCMAVGMKGMSGFWSDKSGRRAPFIQWGYLLSGLGKPVIAGATLIGWPAALMGRALDRFGKGIRTTSRDALIADSVADTQYGQAYGVHATMDTAGAFVGAIIAYLLVRFFLHLDGLRLDQMEHAFASGGRLQQMFLYAGVPGLAAWAITLTLRDRSKAASASKEQATSAPAAALGNAYWRALGLSSIFALANSSDTFLILRATSNGLNFGQAILAYILYNLTYTFMTYPSGSLSDRIGRWRLLGIGWLFYALVYAGFAVLSGNWIWLLFGLYGLYIGATDGVTKALVADLAPKNARGRAMGMFYTVTGIATLGASLIAGVLWQTVSPAATFWFGAGAALLAAALIPLTKKLGQTR